MLKSVNGKLTATEIERLFTEKVQEGRTLEYKQTVGNSDDEKRELLEDITSFANTDGGWLLIGISEEDESGKKVGYPTKIVSHRLLLNSFREMANHAIADNVRPRLHEIDFCEIGMGNVGSVIGIRIGASRSRPHVVERKKKITCVRRNAHGKQPMDSYELKEAYLRSMTIADEMQRFITNRQSQIVERHFDGLNINGQPLWAVHVLPESAFTARENVPLDRFRSPRQVPQTVSGQAISFLPNHLGLLASDRGSTSGTSNSYVQWYRNGVVESVSGKFGYAISEATTFNNEIIQPGTRLLREGAMVGLTGKFLANVCHLYGLLDVGPPYYVSAFLADCAGYGTKHSTSPEFGRTSQLIAPKNLVFPILEIETGISTPDEGAWILRPVFEHLAQAVGIWDSPMYSSDGNLNESVHFNDF
jgi:hypothetical protein